MASRVEVPTPTPPGSVPMRALVPAPHSVSSPASSCDKVSNYPLENLHLEWDNIPEVRNRLRNGQHLFLHFDEKTGALTNHPVEKTLQNVRQNRKQLAPVNRRVRDQSLQLPNIDNIIEEMRLLYRASKVDCTHDTLYHESWACRRLLSLGKNTLLHRKYLSEDGSANYILCGSMCVFNACMQACTSASTSHNVLR